MKLNNQIKHFNSGLLLIERNDLARNYISDIDVGTIDLPTLRISFSNGNNIEMLTSKLFIGAPNLEAVNLHSSWMKKSAVRLTDVPINKCSMQIEDIRPNLFREDNYESVL